MKNKGTPTLLGVALTNRPHVRFRDGYEVSVVGEPGNEMIRVPFLRKGEFKHPVHGKLVFDEDFFDKLIANHVSKTADYNVGLDYRHDPNFGALAWFEADKGGRVVKEGDALVGYGKPTTDKALELVKSNQFLYASVEYDPYYTSNMLTKLEENKDLIELSIVELEENTMDELEKALAKIEELQSDNAALTAEVATLKEAGEAKAAEAAELAEANATLEAKLAENVELEEDDIPAEYRVRLEALEAENREIKTKAYNAEVDRVISLAAHRADENKRGFSAYTLNHFEALLKGNETGSVKLEEADRGNLAAVVDYFRSGIIAFLENAPGEVQLEQNTETIDTPAVANDNAKFTKEDYASLWQ